MSTAIAMAPSPAPHDRPAYVDHAVAAATTSAKTAGSPPSHRIAASPSTAATGSAQKPKSRSPEGRSVSTTQPKSSPAGSRTGMPPKIIVKKEPPTSPEMPTPRHRPRKLDLSKNTTASGNGRQSASATGGPLTSDRGAPTSSGLGIQDVGLACLSPGFTTQDPTMRQQLERSISVREQQRQLIESRLQQSAKPGDTPVESAKEKESFAHKGPQTSTRRKAPPGLSIVAPPHEQFAHERVIQSAPLNQTFTGRHQPQPITRHVANQPSNLSNTSHIHHVPANQTANRLPPISDVFAAESLGALRDREAQSRNSMLNPSTTPGRQGFVSPQNAHPQPPPSAGRSREYRSAEDAQAELSGGRPELLPKLIHYGGHQPPTPPSPGHRGPQTGDALRHEARSNGLGASSSRRRGRAEYEEGESPPLGPPPSATRRNAQAMHAAAGIPLPTATGPFGEGRDSPRMMQAKKEEFMSLCARAWDLFHS